MNCATGGYFMSHKRDKLLSLYQVPVTWCSGISAGNVCSKTAAVICVQQRAVFAKWYPPGIEV